MVGLPILVLGSRTCIYPRNNKKSYNVRKFRGPI